MAVSTKDDKVKATLSSIDATPSNYDDYGVRSTNDGKNDGRLS